MRVSEIWYDKLWFEKVESSRTSVSPTNLSRNFNIHYHYSFSLPFLFIFIRHFFAVLHPLKLRRANWQFFFLSLVRRQIRSLSFSIVVLSRSVTGGARALWFIASLGSVASPAASSSLGLYLACRVSNALDSPSSRQWDERVRKRGREREREKEKEKQNRSGKYISLCNPYGKNVESWEYQQYSGVVENAMRMKRKKTTHGENSNYVLHKNTIWC